MRNEKGQFVKGNHVKTEFKKGQKSWNEGMKLPWLHHDKQFKKDRIPWNKGLKGFMKGDKNGMWKGGVSPMTMRNNAPRPMPEQCEVCGAFGKDSKNGICFDHDHKTGEFRGWLCTRCNAALGLVHDNSETLIALSNYLKSNKKHE